MPDNPIKHSDLIEPGNAFDQTIKGLKEMIKLVDKLLKGVQKSAKIQQDIAKKQDVTSKKGQANIKNMATATAKLSTKEKEMLRIKQSLEKQQAKLTLMDSKAYKELVKTTQAVNAKNAALKKSTKQIATGVKTTNTWSKALGSFAFKFNAMGNIAANMFQRAFQMLKQFVKGSFEAYDKQIKAEKSLLVALNNRTDATRRLISQSKELQKITLFGDEETIKAQALIAAFVDEEAAIRRIIPLVQDFAQAKSVDLSVAADLVSKTLGSSTNAMSRYGIAVEGAVGSSERLESLVVGLSDAFGGQAEAAAIVDSNFTQLKNTIGDVQESIGEYMSSLIFMFRVQANLVGKSEKEWGTISVAEAIASKELFKFKREMKNTASATVALDEVRESAKAVGDQYKQAVKDANNAKRRDFAAANLVVKGLRDQKEAYKILIPSIEQYIGTIKEKVEVDEEEVVVVEEVITVVEELAHAIESGSISGIKFIDLVGDAIQNDIIKPLKNEVPVAAEIAKKSFEDVLDDISKGLNTAGEVTTQFTDLFAAQKAKELSIVGDNAAKREVIEKKYAKKEQQLAITSAIINTAQGIVKVLSDYGLPWGLIPAAAMAALGAVQISTISSQEFAEGGSGLLDDKGGVLQGKSHAQGGVNLGAIGEAERGEYFGIVNKQMTKKYGGELPGIFDSLNNGAFHEVWNNRSSGGDPYNKKIYEAMMNTPQFIPEGKRTERYPNGRTRIVNG